MQVLKRTGTVSGQMIDRVIAAGEPHVKLAKTMSKTADSLIRAQKPKAPRPQAAQVAEVKV
jgi:hypothetical protein